MPVSKKALFLRLLFVSLFLISSANSVGIFAQTNTPNTGRTDTAIITIEIFPAVNQPPDAVDDTKETEYGETTTVDVLENDTDPENDGLDVISTTDPVNG
ncbi:MAG: Ig-like domain-containing protein, partial [Patescibacteria group bacterium]